jgi:hypothetical protein
MFEWGGGTLWCDDKLSLEKFDVGPIEERLPLSPETKIKLEELTVIHDEALDWDYPSNPSKWTEQQFSDFDTRVKIILTKIQKELGDEFSVEYVKLG